jgi:uncharacterized repeat protein (TIGR01451 family)
MLAGVGLLASATPTRAATTSGAAALSAGDITVVEGDAGIRHAVITVRLSKAVGQVVTVDVATVAGSATADVDFSPTSTRVVLNRRQTTASFSVPIIGDETDEPDEQLTVVLSNAVGATIADGSALVTITDDDEPQTDPADLRLVLTDDEAADQLLVGDALVYTATVRNLGPGAAEDVVVADRLPDGTTFLRADPACALGNDGETVTCTRTAALPAGETWAPTITASVDVADTVINSAQVTAASPDSNSLNNSDSELTTPVAPDADVRVLNVFVSPLTGSPQQTWEGKAVIDEDSAYRVTVVLHNDGPTRADGVEVELYDELRDSVLGTSSCNPVPPVVAEPELRTAVACGLGSLAAGEERSVVFDLRFDELYSPWPSGHAPYDFQDRLLSVDVRSGTPGQAPTVRDGNVMYRVATFPEYYLTGNVFAPADARVNSVVRIAGELRNLGPWAVARPTITLWLPVGVQFVTWGGLEGCTTTSSTDGSTVRCTYPGQINAGGQGASGFHFDVRPITPGPKEIGVGYAFDEDHNLAQYSSADGATVTVNVTLV